MSFQCDRCGQCCRTHRVPLTVTDLRRLSQTIQGTRISDCVEWLDSESVDFDDEPESFLELREGRRVPFLRHVPADAQAQSTMGAPQSQCVFLGQYGCQVFSARPSACRSYPYDRLMVHQNQRRLTLAPAVQCPEATDVLVTLKSAPQLDPTAQRFAHDIAVRDAELSAHATWVARHNRLMRVLVRMGRPRLSATETVRRMLGPEPPAEHSTE